MGTHRYHQTLGSSLVMLCQTSTAAVSSSCLLLGYLTFSLALHLSEMYARLDCRPLQNISLFFAVYKPGRALAQGVEVCFNVLLQCPASMSCI